MDPTPSAHAISRYATTTGNLAARVADRPLTPQQRSSAEGIVQARIDAHGSYRIRKHTVLITASR